MKTAGSVLTVLGGLLVLSSLRLAIAQYNLSSSHDLGKFLGGLGFAVFVLVAGVSLLKKGQRES